MTRQVWKLAAIVAIGVGALGGGLLLALPTTWPEASWPVATAASHEARAMRAARSDPPDLAVARMETRQVLRQRPLDAGAWARLAWIADQDGDVPAMLEALDRSYIAAPYWAERLVKLRQIDTHIFYRWTGAWGLPGAFSGTHAGTEPVIEKLAALATYVEELPTPVTVADVVLEDVATPVLTLMPPAATESNLELGTGDGDARSEIEQGVEQAATAAPAPQPAVVTNPLAPTVTAPQRRSRIAAPR